MTCQDNLEYSPISCYWLVSFTLSSWLLIHTPTYICISDVSCGVRHCLHHPAGAPSTPAWLVPSHLAPLRPGGTAAPEFYKYVRLHVWPHAHSRMYTVITCMLCVCSSLHHDFDVKVPFRTSPCLLNDSKETTRTLHFNTSATVFRGESVTAQSSADRRSFSCAQKNEKCFWWKLNWPTASDCLVSTQLNMLNCFWTSLGGSAVDPSFCVAYQGISKTEASTSCDMVRCRECYAVRRSNGWIFTTVGCAKAIHQPSQLSEVHTTDGGYTPNHC